MKLLYKLLLIVVLVFLQGCQGNNTIQFSNGIELCDENGITILVDEIVIHEGNGQLLLRLTVENDNLKKSNISFSNIKVNGLITQEINESQYIYLNSGQKENMVVSVDYSDIASVGIDGIEDLTSIELTITAGMVEMPNINYLDKNVTIYPFGIEKQLDMQYILESYQKYENEYLKIYCLGYEDGNLKFYIKNKMSEDIAMDIEVEEYTDKNIANYLLIEGNNSSEQRYTYVDENADILVKIPIHISGKIECSFELYYSAYFRQAEPLFKDSFIIEIDNN